MIISHASFLVISLMGFLFPGLHPTPTNKDFHDIHVSKCEIQWNESASTLEVATQIYLDDLQKALSKQGADDLHLCTDREVKNADTYLKQYLDKRFAITIDGKAISSSFIGKEPSEDQIAVWCYLELKVPADFKQLKVKYDVLMDIYDDQKNILVLKIKGKNGYLLFNTKHAEETVDYN